MAVAAEIEDSYFLSPLQQGMLFESLYGQQLGVNIEQVVCTLPEKLEVDLLKQAWSQVLEMHPVLRTSFEWSSLEQPIQKVHRSLQLPWTEYDWRDRSADQQAEQLQTFLNRDRQQGFRLTEAPLFRLTLFRLGETKYQLVWTFHHLLLDGRSLTLLLQEVFDLYDAVCRGQNLPLKPARPDYRQHIDWLQQQDVAAAKGFWQELLAGFASPTPLPLSARHLPDRSTGEKASIYLSAALTAGLQTFAQQHGFTPNTLIQAAWALLLNRYSGQEDVVFGATRACRHSGLLGAELMIGLLINTLPVRVQMPATASLIPWLQALRSQHLSIRTYEHTPLANVQTWSEVPPGIRLFESIVVFENYLLNTKLQQQGGLWQNRDVQQFEQPFYPLVLLAGLGCQLRLKILYDPRQFEPAAVDRILGNLQTLLAGMVANPDQSIASLPILSPAERQQLLSVESNATDVAYPDHLCLHHLFEAQVASQLQEIAVTCAGRSLSYQELNQQANQVAHALQKLGVGPEVPVGICLERSLAMVVGLLGILKAGGAYVPLDPTYPAARLTHIVADSQVAIVLTQTSLLPCFPAETITTLCLDQLQAELVSQSVENPASLVTTGNLAYIIYTSGSTGLPKGVLIEHRGAVNTILDINRRFQVGAGDRGLGVCSLNFDLSVFDIFGLLAAGGRIVLPKPASLPELSDWITLMQQEQITLWNSAPPVLQMVADYLGDRGLTLPASLRLVLLSGDWIPISLPGLVRQLKPANSPVEIISLGGATEASIWSIAYSIQAIDPNWKSIPYGRPLTNQQFYILDSQGDLAPLGAIGELYIGGQGVARGYHNRPDLNASKFRPDPFRQLGGGQLYRTGDLGRYLPDGNIEFLGRIDGQVKIRGFRVELAEIETVLSQHPKIRQSTVLLREDEPGKQSLVAYLVAAEAPASNELRQFLQLRLPEYMIPASFVWLTSLPLTPNGKINRQALPLPDLTDQVLAAATAYLAPRTPVEQALTQIWQNVLGVEPIGVKDNFFALGGHSLLAVRMLTQIESQFGKCLPITTLLGCATIEAVSNLILDSQEADLASNLVVLNRGGSKPPLFCLYGILLYQALANHLHPEQPVYGIYLQEEVELLKAGKIEAFMAKFSNLVGVATRCLEMIRTLQPQGPYYLAGASLGGAIAYEIAQQLQAAGEQVALVAMIDTYNPNCDRRQPWHQRWQTHRALLAKYKLSYLWQKTLLQQQGATST
jgi:amino acid adenylation domain-containing protein